MNPDEAAIVVRACELYASGAGYATIASTLNAESAPAPRTWKDPTSKWSAGIGPRTRQPPPLSRRDHLRPNEEAQHRGQGRPDEAPAVGVDPRPGAGAAYPIARTVGRRRGAHRRRCGRGRFTAPTGRCCGRPAGESSPYVLVGLDALWRLRRLDGGRLVGSPARAASSRTAATARGDRARPRARTGCRCG